MLVSTTLLFLALLLLIRASNKHGHGTHTDQRSSFCEPEAEPLSLHTLRRNFKVEDTRSSEAMVKVWYVL